MIQRTCPNCRGLFWRDRFYRAATCSTRCGAQYRRKLSAAERDVIVAADQDGKTPRQIADSIGRPDATVYGVIAEFRRFGDVIRATGFAE